MPLLDRVVPGLKSHNTYTTLHTSSLCLCQFKENIMNHHIRIRIISAAHSFLHYFTFSLIIITGWNFFAWALFVGVWSLSWVKAAGVTVMVTRLVSHRFLCCICSG